MNVLSLFDGMSCGQIALKRAGVKLDKYFASEIDKHAIEVAKKNYPDTVHLGCVTDVKAENLPVIDILIGGSPCQGFSFAGKQLNFDDPRSQLFFEYVRLLKELKPKYFLLENVKMKKESQDIITEYLGVEPIMINSALLSAQNRPRLYWTNILGVKQPEDRGITLRQIYDSQAENYEFIEDSKTQTRDYKKTYLQYDINKKGHGSQDQRAYYLDGKHGCLDTGASGKSKILEDNGRVRKTTRNEAERLQTVPDNYTSAVSETQAKKMLGNGWTVDVIAHILRPIAYMDLLL